MLRRFTASDISDFGCAYNAYSRDALTPVLGVIGKSGRNLKQFSAGHALACPTENEI